MISPVSSVVPRSLVACLAFVGVLAVSAFAADRSIRIEAPRQVPAGAPVNVPVSVITQTGNGEKIGFFHGEYSVDEGKSWTAFTFDQNLEAHALRRLTLNAGKGGSTIKIRVRIAFRGGAAGDVDYLGKPIDWEGTWTKWSEPPAMSATIRVVGR
jgi:hypothetical protein